MILYLCISFLHSTINNQMKLIRHSKQFYDKATCKRKTNFICAVSFFQQGHFPLFIFLQVTLFSSIISLGFKQYCQTSHFNSTIQLFNYSTIQRFNNSSFQLFSYWSFQLFNGSSFQLFNYSSTQLFNYSTIQLLKFSTVQLFNNWIVENLNSWIVENFNSWILQ